MENKINIAELLKNCPKGMELDSTMYNSVTLLGVDNGKDVLFPIRVLRPDGCTITLTKYGQYTDAGFAKCVIFPKGETTWKGFHKPFKDGDILAYTSSYTTVFIYRNKDDEPKFTTSFYVGHTIGVSYCDFHIYNQNKLTTLNGNCNVRLATEEEKEKLFQAIKDNGYKWNSENKMLEKLPKFKVGDRVKHISAYASGIVVKVTDKGYYIDYPKGEGICFISFTLEKDYELVPNKFDITTLKPFESRVLVRDANCYEWEADIFGRYSDGYITLGGGKWKQCIPYEGNEHLLGTTNDCDEFFKTWNS